MGASKPWAAQTSRDLHLWEKLQPAKEANIVQNGGCMSLETVPGLGLSMSPP